MDLYERAHKTIKKNFTNKGLVAGSTHFNDLWARDALYACWGLHDKEPTIVNETLDTLKKHTNTQGQIPLRIGNKNMLLTLLKIPSPQGPKYANDKNKDPALDPNSLYLITLAQQKTHDKKIIIDKAHTKKVVDWLLRFQRRDGLFEEGTYASWDDCLKKSSASTYNNVLIYQALLASKELLGDKKYVQYAEKLRETTNKKLYNKKYYDAWEDMPVLDVAGNLLTIHFGLANKEQEKNILETLDDYKKKNGDVLAKTNYPPYPKKAVYHPFKLLGMADYHNQGPYWSWIAALEALVRQDKRTIIHKELQEFFDKGEGIHEIYDKKGVPTKRFFYQSEQDFTWTAGLLLATKK